MIIEPDKKVSVNYLGIILGTQCNLNCLHCSGGDIQKHMTIQPEIVDSLLDNISVIDDLNFIGYEVTLYLDQMQMILDKIKERKIKTRHLKILTNGVICSQRLIDIYKDFVLNYTTKPERSKIVFSHDKFHWNNGFSQEQFIKNLNWYKQAIGDIGTVESRALDHGLMLVGRAKELPNKILETMREVKIYKQYNQNKIEFRPICQGTMNTCENGGCVHNCIGHFISVIPNGYIFLGDMDAFKAISENDYSNSLGNIQNESLYDMILRHNEEYKNNTSSVLPVSIFWEDTLLRWSYLLIYRYLQFRNQVIQSVSDNDFTKKYELLKHDLVNQFDYFKENIQRLIIRHGSKYEIEKQKTTDFKIDGMFNLSIAMLRKWEKQIIKELDAIRILTIRLSVNLITRTELYNELKKLIADSPFNENNFFGFVGYDYDTFCNIHQCYDNHDFEGFEQETLKARIKSIKTLLKK